MLVCCVYLDLCRVDHVMRVVNRQGQELKVNQSQNRLLKLLYSHFLGRCALKVLTQ